jgi:hypothetical protein
MDFDQINKKSIYRQKQTDEYYGTIVQSVYSTIEREVENGNLGCFFELPLFRFGEPLGNPVRMTQKIQEILVKDNISVTLVQNGPYIFLNWEQAMANRRKYGTSSSSNLTSDQLADKYRSKVSNYLKEKRKN